MTMTARFLPQYPKRIDVTDGLTKAEGNGIVRLGFDYAATEFGAELSQAVDSANSSATSANSAFSAFDKRYLGSKPSDPSTDNTGAALIEGALYWNSVSNLMKVYSGASWLPYGGGDMLTTTYDVDDIQADAFGKGIPVKLTTDIGGLTVPAVVAYLRTSGYSSVGTGGAVFVRVVSEPTHSFKKQSADGQWWEVSGDTVTPLLIGAAADGVTDDTAAIQATLSALGRYKTVVFPTRTFVIQCGIKLTSAASYGTIRYENPTFLISDAGPTTLLRDGITAGKIGIYFNNVYGLSVTGSARFVGTGTAGSSQLAGLVYEKCNFINDQSASYFDNMAAGRMAMWCNRSFLGVISAINIKGRQTFEGPSTTATAGSAEVVIGCYESVFGEIVSINNYKPIRYLSVGQDETGSKIDNVRCSFKYVTGTAYTGSAESSVCSIRSAVDCHFAGGSGNGFGIGFNVVRYDTDTGWSVDRVSIDSVSGVYLDTGASTDTAFSIDAPDTHPIGKVVVGRVVSDAHGELAGLITSGEVSIDQFIYTGSPTRGLQVSNSKLKINYFEGAGQAFQAIAYGLNAEISIADTNIKSGPTTSTNGAIEFNSSFGGTGSRLPCAFNRIKYTQGGAPNNYAYIMYDASNGFEQTHIEHIEGVGGAGVLATALFAGIGFYVRNGLYHGQAAPSAGTYNVGTVLFGTPAAGAPMGWMCVSGGTPGTWKAMANIAS